MKNPTNCDTVIWAIVPAAGIGSRFSGSTPKQYTNIHGKTILEHSVLPFLQTNKIKKIFIAIAVDDIDAVQLPLLKDNRIEFVQGGKTRADSVLNALLQLQKVCAPNDWILIHDAVRPCLLSQNIDHLIGALIDSEDAVILATPSTDTLKHISNNRIDSTIDRDSTWQAQTPQAFRFSIILSALQNALSKGIHITDESSAIEALGKSPLLLNGFRSNIKITFPEDLELASFYLLKIKHSTNDVHPSELES